MNRERWKSILGPALLEAVLLTIGVALALGAEEWREAREHRSQARAATAAITEEMESNRAAVSASAEYHAALFQSLRSRRDSQPPDIRLFSRGFVSPAPVAFAAWQTATETGVLQYMPHDLVLRLSRVYGPQSRYERQSEIVGGLIYNEMYKGGPGGIMANHQNLAHLISAFMYRERQLLTMYDSTLAALERAHAD